MDAGARLLPGARLVAALLIAVLACFAAAETAGAHPSHWVVANVEVRRDATFVVDVLFERGYVPDRFGQDSPEVEIAGLPADRDLRLESFGLVEALAICFDGVPAPTRAEWVRPEKIEEIRLRLSGSVPAGARSITVTNRVRGPWATSVRHEGDESAVLSMLDPGEAMEPVDLHAGFVPKPAAQTAAEFVGHGITHIVPHGLDHMLFVLGLFLLSARIKPLLTQVTAFTVAHTVTLALSTTGTIRLPSSVVEPLIAASIAYVAVENICLSRVRATRLLLVFAFGLLHGMGFAGALADLGLPPGNRALALVSFNVGVELGQLSVLTVAWLVIGLPFREKPWYRARVVVPLSAAIAAVGLYWAVTRAFGL